MRNWILAISAALCYASSSILIKKGLSEFNSPLLGATIAQIFSALAYGLFLIGGRHSGNMHFKGAFSMNRKSAVYLVITGILLAMGTLLRWTSLSLAPVVIVAPIKVSHIGLEPQILESLLYLPACSRAFDFAGDFNTPKKISKLGVRVYQLFRYFLLRCDFRLKILLDFQLARECS